jgi:hypothetical protein
VDSDGNTEVYELLKDGGRNQAGQPASEEEIAKYSSWTLVDVPVGMTSEQFNERVRINARAIGQARDGQPYSPWGGRNSNRYVFDVITSSGGMVPYNALLGGFRFAPGICGGTGLNIGQQCSQ